MGLLNVRRIRLGNTVGLEFLSQSWCWGAEHLLFVSKAAWLGFPGSTGALFLHVCQPAGTVSQLSKQPEAPIP